MNMQLSTLLAQHGLRTTRARIAVFDALSHSSRPLDIQEITTHCPDVNRSSIYRVLSLFLDYAIIQTVPRGWKPLYELSDSFKPHHHHFICDKCGVIVDIATEDIEQSIDKVANQKGITLTSHHIELRGICNNCTT